MIHVEFQLCDFIEQLVLSTIKVDGISSNLSTGNNLPAGVAFDVGIVISSVDVFLVSLWIIIINGFSLYVSGQTDMKLGFHTPRTFSTLSS